MKKIAVIATHPIQYQVPLWQKMTADGINIEVWYFTDFGLKSNFDIEFGKTFSWDLPLLEGYKYRFLKVNENASPNKGFKGILLKENIKKLYKENNITHVYINGWLVGAYWQALWAAKSLGLITIFKGESNDLKPENKWKWPIKKFLLKKFFCRIDYFLYIGEANKRLYIKYGIPNKKLFPGLYCVDNHRFQQSTSELQNRKTQIRKKWGIPNNYICLLFSGKFIPKKRPLDIIQAVQEIIKTQNNLHLLFVGDGELYEAIKARSNVIYNKEKGLVGPIKFNKVNISLTGFLNQTEIPQAYVAADALILPSDFGETWGLVVNEAMACGLSAIVSDQCGSSEDLIKPIDSNLIFKTGDIKGLQNSIFHFLENPPAKEKIEEIINTYTFKSTTDSIIKILNK